MPTKKSFTNSITRPFLKWAGGKSRLIGRIKSVLPSGARLIEPFVGSGAVFINTNYDSYLLSDSNSDLINLFNQLKDEQQSFIDYVHTFFIPENNTRERFYELRQLFNESTDIRLKSALFIYLNRHGFNGLCRYNTQGNFNVPCGRYINPPYMPILEMQAFAQKAQKAIFRVSDFRDTMKEAKNGDIIYCDPPYIPLSQTSNFTDYSVNNFTVKDQSDLAELAYDLSLQGITVIISNHDTEWTRQAYKNAKIQYFDVKRLISAKTTNRGKAAELLAIF